MMIEVPLKIGNSIELKEYCRGGQALRQRLNGYSCTQ
jgi:hypothetical protein